MTLSRLVPATALLVTALPLAAHEKREMDAHVHGTGAVQIAIDGPTIAMEITVPGADIVGFEHAPGTDADRAALDAALAKFADAFTLFTLQGDPGCTSVTKIADTHGYGVAPDHGDDHDAHGADDHGADAVHDDHDHDTAADAGHDDHDHDDGANHAEFHAVYEMTCADPDALTAIAFPYFDLFENAQKLDVQIVSDTGAMAAEVTRAAPVLSLAGAM